MLTKEQILSKMRGFNCPKYLTESCWQPIYDQCVAAIDLATENERLKAKAKHYVCIRERNRETIDDLKGKLNTSESENERLKSKLDAERTVKPMTNFDRIMANMTIEQMAELFVRDETRQEYPDDIPYDSYTTEHTPGYYCFRDDAVKAEIEWLKKEWDA